MVGIVTSTKTVNSPPVRVLAVVELGNNWGHLLRVLPVIDSLLAEGHEVLFAVPDVGKARLALQRSDIALVKCPGALVAAQVGAFEYEFYAQILERCVFGDDQLLARSIAQWDELLSTWRPDVMLTDFAPGALFAARLHQLPVVQIPVGWEAPPLESALPVIRPWKKVDPAVISRYEDRLRMRLNLWCDLRGANMLEELSDLYAIGTQLLTTFPEIDCFGPRCAEVNYVGPIITVDRGIPLDWASDARSSGAPFRVLVYLKPSPALVPVLMYLRTVMRAEIIAILQELPPIVVGHLRSVGIRVVDAAVQLQRLLADAHLVVSNAGHGVAAAALLAGVPLLTIPLTIDQFLLASKLGSTGAAVVMPDGEASLRLSDGTVAQLLREGTYCKAAKEFAQRYAGRSQHRTINAIVQALLDRARTRE